MPFQSPISWPQRVTRWRGRAVPLACGSMLVAMVWACGGSQASQTSQTSQGPEGPQRGGNPDAIMTEEQLAVRQEAACDGVGGGLYRCALEGARHKLSPEEFAKLGLDTEGAEHDYRSKFMEECLAGNMSPRQIRVFERCLADTRCNVFVPCLDQAKPRR